MIVVTKTERYCPCCSTEMATVTITDKHTELQCFNCGYTKTKDESNVKEGIF